MNIIIVTDGKFGVSLCEKLAEKGKHEITLIDKKDIHFQKITDSHDIHCIKGSGSSAAILLLAGVKNSDLLIAATASDEMNIIASLIAKKLGAKHTITRIRDPEYAAELTQLETDLGLDVVINPDKGAAFELLKVLEFPEGVNVRNLCGGQVRLIEVKVTERMPIAGDKLRDIPRKIPKKAAVLIGAVTRDNKHYIPKGEFTVLPGDRLFVIGKPGNIFHFCQFTNLPVHKIHNIIIVGGGHIGYYLAKNLCEIAPFVTVMEIDKKRCTELSETLPDALIINEDGTDIRNLTAQNIEKCDSFVALTDIDEENLIAALMAYKKGIPKCAIKMTRFFYHEIVDEFFGKAKNVINIVSPHNIAADYILEYVHGIQGAVKSTGKTVYNIIENDLYAIEFIVDASSSIINQPLYSLSISFSVIVAVIIRKNNVIIPTGETVIKIGDSVIVFSCGKILNKIDDILRE